MSDALDALDPGAYVQPGQHRLVRAVTSQQQKMATASLVETPDEQMLLEQLLEATKPREHFIRQGWHYLIASPFRYPPLRYGSRFGNRLEPAIFYASDSKKVAFAEVAYYRQKLLSTDMAEPIQETVRPAYTVFTVQAQSPRMLDLTQPPYDVYEQEISSPKSYTASQDLGTRMRAQQVAYFRYASARADGVNTGVFHIKALAKQPIATEQWHAFCATDEFSAVRADFAEKIVVPA